MISVLVPVFNTDVVELVKSISHQSESDDAEVVVMDDASTDPETKFSNKNGLSGLRGVRYIELENNQGRNIIRHTLAEAARHETLLFLDADSGFPDQLWFERYRKYAGKKSVVMGGRQYRENKQSGDLLHYRYGSKRESSVAAQRSKHPYQSFMACNFLITRGIFLSLIQDGNLHGYCHEDTFMGLQFERLGIPVIHIDNPVFHEGLDADKTFVTKQSEAIRNLFYLYSVYGNQFHFKNQIRLIATFEKIRQMPGGSLALRMMIKYRHRLKNYFLSTKKLFWMDIWKLEEFANCFYKTS